MERGSGEQPVEEAARKDLTEGWWLGADPQIGYPLATRHVGDESLQPREADPGIQIFLEKYRQFCPKQAGICWCTDRAQRLYVAEERA